MLWVSDLGFRAARLTSGNGLRMSSIEVLAIGLRGFGVRI